MAGREGTRRKKISVLHMLGTWEGYIDGCNCPGCKEVEAEEKVSHYLLNKGNKNPTKKGKKPGRKPKEIDRAEIEISEDPTTGETIAENISTNYKTGRVPSNSSGSSETSQEKKMIEKVVIAGSSFEIKSKSGSCEIKSSGDSENESESNRNFNVISISKPIENCERVETNTNKVKVLVGSTDPALPDIDIECEDDDQAFDDVLSISSEKKSYSSELDRSGSRQKPLHNKLARVTDDVKIKEEPEEYFSDEEEIERGRGKRPSEMGRLDPRGSKRARMVTSEVENIYAKPRMVFTGKGVVRKYEPGVDKTPKSKRGRKPGKIVIPIKIKQEPREFNEDEENEIDQLHQALSEAADNLSGGEDEEYLLQQLEEDQKDGISRLTKKKSNKLFKRVETDGDKYVECNMCFKMLKESSIKQHYKTHTGEKPYHCDECNARFTRKGDVDRHRKLVHKNLKPFKCQKCEKEFSDRKNLKIHLQNHDKAIYYSCDTCNFKFGKREYYENHIRYIHPLPDGIIPVFSELDEDLAGKQLRELEKEERRESLAKNGDSNEKEFDDEIDEEEKAMEITVTEGQENKVLSSGKIGNIKRDKDMNIECENLLPSDTIGADMPLLEADSAKEISDKLIDVNQNASNTAVTISNGTISFTQTVVDTETQDEELVNKAIAAAVSQAASTIESLQSLAGPNISGSNGEEEFYTDEEDDDMLDEEDDIQEMLDAEEDMLPTSGNNLTPTKPVDHHHHQEQQQQQQQQQPTEIHINASVGGQMRKFIIQVPAGSNLNIQTPEGMEMIVSMVNQLCAGKGDLDGPIEVVMHNPNDEQNSAVR
ncbi:unnamed protein product [Meganyctiphanes norvegica]|uniref:C2H2-type domain-containing protein n=1 Tax=Meganyctiphanes norvegica TaxID=48144 RepID=A0AAV2QAH5_MEGNR